MSNPSEGINGLSGFYDVLHEYLGDPVRIVLKHHDTTVAGTVRWVGAHLVELEAGQERRWVGIADIATILTATPPGSDKTL